MTLKKLIREGIPWRPWNFREPAYELLLIFVLILQFPGVLHAQKVTGLLSGSFITAIAQSHPAPKTTLKIKPSIYIREAREVIKREFGAAALHNLELRIVPSADQRDVFEYEATDGHLMIRGSSGVALCGGFYQYIRHNHLGIASWSGNRLDLSRGWPDTPLTHVESPYRYRYYFNVVTYGYTMPYWTWNRWQREIDWMALHGINMPLSLVATEAIGERVWKKLGLTKNEIDNFYTGPAHLPWQRMGNLAKLDGPLTPGWNKDQIILEHQILNRERSLGMFPIAQGFAGFVPLGLQRIYPEVKLTAMPWGGFSKEYQNHILPPNSPLFARIGALTIKEWEAEFGKIQFFLSDSFNEMVIPANGVAAKDTLLANYGNAIYRSIQAGDSNATWVMQGWMFGYMRKTWTKDAVRSLLSKVPDDKLLILDEAMDYNADFWNNGMNRDLYDGFFGKQWIGGYIPNMGGDTAFTGVLDFYAHGGSDVLTSKNRGNLVGLGIVPEGIENNEVIYELIADTFWQSKPIDLSVWVNNYIQSRYGASNENIREAWKLLLESCYSSFVNHPRFIWQLQPASTRSNVDLNPKIIEAARYFLAGGDSIRMNSLYRDDAVEMTAMAAGIRADQLIQQAMKSYKAHDISGGKKSAKQAFVLLDNLNRLLASHPNLQLKTWVDFARAHGDTPQEKNHYEENAKLLITLWGYNGEVDDYSNRIWSGLIGSYYVPRWQMYFENLVGAHHDIRAWEKQWARTETVTKPQPFSDPVEAAKNILEKMASDAGH